MAPSTSNTVTEQMSWVGGLGEFKVSSLFPKGNELADRHGLNGTLTLFNNSDRNTTH